MANFVKCFSTLAMAVYNWYLKSVQKIKPKMLLAKITGQKSCLKNKCGFCCAVWCEKRGNVGKLPKYLSTRNWTSDKISTENQKRKM